LFKLCYDQLRNDKASREKLQRVLKGQMASTSRKAMSENYPNMSPEDLESIRTFSKQTIITMKNLKQAVKPTASRKRRVTTKPAKGKLIAPPPPPLAIEEISSEDDDDDEEEEEPNKE